MNVSKNMQKKEKEKHHAPLDSGDRSGTERKQGWKYQCLSFPLPSVPAALAWREACAPPTAQGLQLTADDFRTHLLLCSQVPGQGGPAPHFFGSTQRTVVLSRLIPPSNSRLLPAGGTKALT